MGFLKLQKTATVAMKLPEKYITIRNYLFFKRKSGKKNVEQKLFFYNKCKNKIYVFLYIKFWDRIISRYIFFKPTLGLT